MKTGEGMPWDYFRLGVPAYMKWRTRKGSWARRNTWSSTIRSAIANLATELNYAAYIVRTCFFSLFSSITTTVGANPHILNAAIFGFRVKVDF